MTHKKNTTDLTELLLKCMAQPDPMLSMLEWLCPRLMETEVFPVSLAQKRMHTIHPAVITAAAIGRVDWISNLSHSQVIEMTKGLNEQVQYFRSRPLTGRYPVIWTNALYEKIRMDGRVVSMAVMVICGVNEQGRRDILAVEPMLEESKESYSQLFESLLDRGLKIPLLVISDANKGLIAAIRESFPGAFWQRCKVHFMRNILAHVSQKEKESFPELDARKISSANMLERLNKEIRRRTSVVGIFPNSDSYLRLVTTYLMEYAEDWSVFRAYLNPKSILSLLNVA
ncbi:MAG: Mutator family transposase [Eubacteriales bacterium]|jgi:putative transposase